MINLSNACLDERLSKIESLLDGEEIPVENKEKIFESIKEYIDLNINDSYASIQTMFDARLENLALKLEAKINSDIAETSFKIVTQINELTSKLEAQIKEEITTKLETVTSSPSSKSRK